MNTLFSELNTNNTAEQRLWQMRLNKLTTDARILNVEYDKLVSANAVKANTDMQRQSLFRPELRERRDGIEEGVVKESAMLDDSLDMMDTAVQQGQLTVKRLRHQNAVLKQTTRRVKWVLQSAGVSQATITAIEKRIGWDRVIVVSGMTLTSLAIYLFYCWWTRSRPLWFLLFRF